MIIDNGDQLPLIISGVFDGVAGVSRGIVAFTPNRAGRSPTAAKGGMLNDEPVRLFDVEPTEDGRSFTARFAAIEPAG